LFRGCSAFHPAEKYHLRVMFKGLQSASLAHEILSMRDRIRFFERSDLESFTLENEEAERETEGDLVNTLGTKRFTKGTPPLKGTTVNPFQVTKVMDMFHCVDMQSNTARNCASASSFEEPGFEGFPKPNFVNLFGGSANTDRPRNSFLQGNSAFEYHKSENISGPADASIGFLDGGTFSIGSAPKQSQRPTKRQARQTVPGSPKSEQIGAEAKPDAVCLEEAPQSRTYAGDYKLSFVANKSGKREIDYV